MNISNRVIKFSYNTIFLHLTVTEKSRRLTCCQTCCLFLKWMRRQKVSTESPDCGRDIVFDCLNGWRCCKVNYWVFVMTVFAVYSLIVLIVPCLGSRDMRGAHYISGSRKIIQSHTKHSALYENERKTRKIGLLLWDTSLEKQENVEMQIGASCVTLRGRSLRWRG